jgi:hypothetical protein
MVAALPQPRELPGSMSFFEATGGRATADPTLPKLLSE